ncbi:MAG TPA: VanZ family protein [Chitinophagaceae bacterium]|nr:VanZ family protein [Chitinophagaceae bacterium]
MSRYDKVQRFVLWGLLICCLLVLTKYILFKRSPRYYKNYFAHEYSSKVIREGWKHANLKPFSTISLFYRSKRLREEYKYDNIGGNIIGFIPLGILLPALLLSFRNFWRIALAGFCISLLFETTQLLTGLGSFDVDDIILNTAGCIIGYLVFLGLKKISRDDYAVH